MPRSKLYLQSSGLADEARFVKLFKETWKAFPLWARRPMLRYYREGDTLETAISGGPSPAIIIIPEPAEDNALGCWRAKRGSFFFWADAVNALPDEHLRTLIAHELTHSYLSATEYYAPGQEEDFVAELIAQWGFDDHALSDYLYEHFKEGKFK
jgi:Zn-dependent protease with chaperone function